MTGTERVNFVSDLVAMARAYDELPQVQEALTNELERNEELRQTVQHLELRIMELKGDLDKAHEFGRKLEAERDDAELRFLELEEQSGRLASMVKAAATHLGMVDKPEPAVVVEEPMPFEGSGGGLSQPLNPEPSLDHIQGQPYDESQNAQEVNPTTTAAPSSSFASDGTISPGERASDPTAPSTAGDGPSSADAPSASDGESASTSGGRYAGRMWSSLTMHEQDEFWRDYDRQRLHGFGFLVDYWRSQGGTGSAWNA